MKKIRAAVVGYGNIGRGVEQSIKRNDEGCRRCYPRNSYS